MTLGRIAMALSGPDLVTLAKELWRRRLWEADNLRVSGSFDASGEWISESIQQGAAVATFFDANMAYYLFVPMGNVVRAAFDFYGDPVELVKMLSDLPFEVASFETRYREWGEGEPPYPPQGFGGEHFAHGWACAFRGNGHNSLVSRRWLEHGPWHLIPGPNDTTLVQFHDLRADAHTARAQAQPGHQRLGISEQSGFLHHPYRPGSDIKGFYDSENRLLKIVVIGRPVSEGELRDACAVRRFNLLGPEQPIDDVAFVFLDPEEARANLPRLWPYALQCRTIIDETETRIDTDQRPR